MLNVGKLAAGSESYYLSTVAAGVGDYYTGGGEASGYWIGTAATDLGLSGRVEPETLWAVLGATHPATARRLTRAAHRRVPGFDLTFRVPKSVSILFGLADPTVSAAVREAHDRAVAAAVRYLERQAAWSRRGENGRERVPARGFAAAAFPGPTGLTRHASTFAATDVLQACCDRLPDGADIPDIEALAATILEPLNRVAVRLLGPQVRTSGEVIRHLHILAKQGPRYQPHAIRRLPTRA